MGEQLTANSAELEKIAFASQHAAKQGEEAVVQIFKTMKQIGDGNQNIIDDMEAGNHRISEISQIIRGIAEKTAAINEIVFQTKLLSFNASVEAARAGEHGKGFAVVAEEVGKLAELSGHASRDIFELIEGSSQKVATIVKENRASFERITGNVKSLVEKGNMVAQDCESAIQEILRQADSVNSMVTQITFAIREENQSLQEISKAMASLNSTTNLNSATSSQTSQTSADLLEQAGNLREVVTDLRQMLAKNQSLPPTKHQNMENQDAKPIAA